MPVYAYGWKVPRYATVVAMAAVTFAGMGLPAIAFDTTQLNQGGSLTLDEISGLIDQSPKLQREVTDAALQANKKPNEIVCGGMRFSGQWVHLGGYRVAPYVCAFGDDKFLEIRADVRITGRGGKTFAKITPDAMKNASRFDESKPTWRWLGEDPRLKQRQ